MKRILSMILVLVMLIGMMPMQAFATEGTQETEAVEVVTEPTEAPEEESTAPAEETESSEEETEPSDEEEKEESSKPSEPEEEAEVIHEHDYEAVVTDPTCTEQGYTTYTCACGDSYVADLLDATGDHTYENGICTGCGEEDYDGLDLNGLNVLCLGDSITAGQGLTTETRWTNVLASKYGWNLTNKSQGGISLSSYYYTANGKSDVSIAKKAEILKTMTTKPDVIIVWGGHNDTSYRYSPLGTWDDETTDSFKGALKYIAELADEYAPDATLFVLTPLWTTEAPSTLKVPENTTDNNWMFVDAIYEGAEAYGWIPVNMDLCGITPFTKMGLLLDNIHPNEAGTEKIVAYLSAELASYSETSKKETIIFNASAVSMKPGESTTLKAVLSPRSGTGTATFTWSSSDFSVATVDASGKITAVAPGTAVITATAPNGISADISVSVVCEHTYEPSVTAPTCTEQGYTTYTCACGDSYVADLLDATGHTYKSGICTVCGMEHPNLTNYEGKVISILGDSISTFAGYIPTADGFNLEHYARYPQANLFTDVEHTWWMQVLTALDAKLGINESWRSTEVGNIYDVEVNSGYEGTKACMASTTRIQNLGSNGTPDVILFYGGTNDITQRRTVGTFDPVTAPAEVDLTSAKWNTVADAYVAAIMRMQYYYPDAEIIAMLPTFTSKNTDAVIEKYNSVFAAICEHYGVTYIDLRDCGITTADLPDGTHPNEVGMDYITAAVLDVLLTDCDLEAGEHTVHSVTHNMNGAKSSLSYYKGVSNGKPFVTIISSDDLDVTVTMGGVDITSDCYANGVVSIVSVTGDVAITAVGKEKTIYADSLQQLPEDVCSGMNLWIALEPENQYYTTTGWGNLSTGQIWSITIPVSAGDRVYANSFEKNGSNGNDYSSTSGIRVTYFDAEGVYKSLSPAEVYAEFAANGYLTIPADVVAVCVPMWTNTEKSVVYLLSSKHTYKNGTCTGCGDVAESDIWQIVENNKVIGAYADLQSAIDACAAGGTVRLTANCAVTSGVQIKKDITIDGGNFLVDISGCAKEFINIAKNVAVTLRDLKLDGGATGFEVDYDAVTYTNYAIPLKAGSLDNDPMAETSAILSFGKQLICENVDISNRYTVSNGAAMQIRSGRLELTDCDFTHNYGGKQGGALYIANSFGTLTVYPISSVTINNCTFTENYTGHGGAIYAMNAAEISITDSVFDRNTANGGKGGALDLPGQNITKPVAKEKGLDYVQTTINNCVFSNNWAGNDGFAIQSYDSELYITDTEFVGNVGVHPTSSMGTVAIEQYRGDAWPLTVRLDNCLFEGNRGACAAYGDLNSPSDLDVTDCIFRGNQGNMGVLLYASTSQFTDCQFAGETVKTAVIDARSYSNFQTPLKMVLTDVSFADCEGAVEILTRKQDHNDSLDTYQIVLKGITNGDINVEDNNQVSIEGNHTGNVVLDRATDWTNLTVAADAAVNGIIVKQPADGEAKLGQRYMVEVKAEGKGLTYQWYVKESGAKAFKVSVNKTASYAYTMQTYMHNRQVYCVITDANGNQVTTETATITRPPQALKILQQPQDAQQEIGQKFSISPNVEGEGLTYQWYVKESGAKAFKASSVKGSAYALTMQKYMIGRQVYCVITDKYGNSVTTDVATISLPPVELKILEQPTDVYAAKGEKFSISPEVQGDGLTYQWYYKEGYMKDFKPSSNKTSAYAYSMQTYMNERSVYCVITDKYGNQVQTEVVTIHLEK